MKLVGLTDLNGNPLWIVPTWVEAIRYPLRTVDDTRTKAVVVLSGETYRVLETPEQVVQTLKESDT